MGYMKIKNLYRPEAQDVLMFKRVYALEKIHGTSAHIKRNGQTKNITFFSGGASHEQFVNLFDLAELTERINTNMGDSEKDIIIYGEAYGGKLQGMSDIYGKKLRFIVFDVKIGYNWLSVPDAEAIASNLGLEFVFYEEVSATVELLNLARDRYSEQARRNIGVTDAIGEGIVIRPLIELSKNNGDRIIAKHKTEAFGETKTQREVTPALMQRLTDAQCVAEEWVTEQRLSHVLDKLGNPLSMSAIPAVVKAMVEDINLEGDGEFVPSKDVNKAIRTRTVSLYKSRVTKINE